MADTLNAPHVDIFSVWCHDFLVLCDIVNEHCGVQKSHDTIQEKCLHMVHFNVPRDWFETNLWHPKRYSEKLWVSRSTGKSNIYHFISNNDK